MKSLQLHKIKIEALAGRDTGTHCTGLALVPFCQGFVFGGMQ